MRDKITIKAGQTAVLTRADGAVRRRVITEWTARGNSKGHDLQLGDIRISTTDQTYRDCGWCWQVTVDHAYGNDAIAQNGGCATEEEAQSAATSWLRRHCEETLSALNEIGIQKALPRPDCGRAAK